MPLARVAVAIALVSAACGGGAGSASINNSITGAIFDPHTIFAWVQTESLQLNTQTYAPLNPEPLAIVLSGGSFDPTQDLRTQGPDALLQIEADEQRNGYLQLWFPDVSKIQLGTAYTTQFGSTSNQPDAPFQFSFGLGYSPLMNASSPPGNPPAFGSAESLTVTFTQLGSSVGSSFACVVVWNVSTFDGDPTDAVSGKMTMSISGQLVNEELAACDASLTDPFDTSVADCDDGFYPAPTTN